jgi:hypothetical protein
LVWAFKPEPRFSNKLTLDDDPGLRLDFISANQKMKIFCSKFQISKNLQQDEIQDFADFSFQRLKKVNAVSRTNQTG